MELDELKIAWTELGRQLERKDLQIAALQRQNGLFALRSRLRQVTFGQVVQLAFGLWFVVWGGSTWSDHWGTWHVVAYGIVLHLYGLALLIAAAVQLVGVARVDYAGPVATIQQRIVDLKHARLRSERFLLALGGVGWVPVMFLLLHKAGLDIWLLQPAHVLLNLAVGLVISAGMLWASFRYPAWFQRTAQGRHLAEIEHDLAELESGFKRGAGGG